MKIKDGVIINEVDGQYIAVDTGADDKRFNGMLRMNKTACFVAKLLEQETNLDAIVKAMTEKYEVTAQAARINAQKVIDTFEDAGLLENI